MILLSHPTGNQNSRQAALALREAGALCQFVTAVHFDAPGTMAKLLPARVRMELARRDFSDVVPAAAVRSVARLRELTRILGGKAGWQTLLRRETGWASVDQVYRTVDRAVARQVARDVPVQAVYAYEDGALATFKAAKMCGLRCIYELPIGYWRTHRRLCDEEARLHPRWAFTWHASQDSDAKVQRKDAELALANCIIVPSRFVAESLRDYPGELPPVSIVPYGCPQPIAPDARRWYGGGKLRVLFVGGLSQRKGLSYLLDAVRLLGNEVELTIIGSGTGRELFSKLPGNQHRLLGSVLHSVVLEEMRKHDVFVFPTLFEGYSLAVAEALSQGLPVITTPSSGAADIITDGKEGWIVPIRDSAAITRCLRQCIDAPETVQRMGLAALELAAGRSWKHYRECLRAVVLAEQAEGAP